MRLCSELDTGSFCGLACIPKSGKLMHIIHKSRNLALHHEVVPTIIEFQIFLFEMYSLRLKFFLASAFSKIYTEILQTTIPTKKS